MDVHLRRVELKVVLAQFLGAVHRDVGVLQQALRVLAVGGIGADADACGEMKFLCAEGERPGDGGEDFLRHLGAAHRLRHSLEQHHELVPAEAADGIAFAQASAQPFRDFLEHAVAGFVAERVVDVLEAVEVDEQDRQLHAVPPRLGECVAEALTEHAAVGQPGELVIMREMTDALLGLLACDEQADLTADRARALQQRFVGRTAGEAEKLHDAEGVIAGPDRKRKCPVQPRLYREWGAPESRVLSHIVDPYGLAAAPRAHEQSARHVQRVPVLAVALRKLHDFGRRNTPDLGTRHLLFLRVLDPVSSAGAAEGFADDLDYF